MFYAIGNYIGKFWDGYTFSDEYLAIIAYAQSQGWIVQIFKRLV